MHHPRSANAASRWVAAPGAAVPGCAPAPHHLSLGHRHDQDDGGCAAGDRELHWRPSPEVIDSLARARTETSGEQPLGAVRIAQWATWDWDIRQDRVFADTALAELFGVAGSEANGGPLATYLAAIHPEDAQRVSGLLHAAIAQRKDYEARYRVLSRVQGERLVIARGRVEYDENGLPVHMPGFILDITDTPVGATR